MRRCCGEAQCTCTVIAGSGVTVTGNGSTSTPYTVAATPLVTGCGLDGTGEAADPLVVVPAAGSAAWPWTGAVATESTLKCDPGTGKLWTPPEHRSSADKVYTEHFASGSGSIAVTAGWVAINASAFVQFAIPANYLGNTSRPWCYQVTVAGTWDINYLSTATFTVGYLLSIDGGAGAVRPLWGLLTAPGAARRERHSGTVLDTGYNRAPGAARTVRLTPAVNVTAGSITVNSWISDAAIITTTNN